MAATIANHGTLMTPYLVQQVTAPDGTVVQTATPDRAQPGGERVGGQRHRSR